MNGRIDGGQLDQWMDEGCTDGGMGWMNGRLNGWMDKSKHVMQDKPGVGWCR